MNNPVPPPGTPDPSSPTGPWGSRPISVHVVYLVLLAAALALHFYAIDLHREGLGAVWRHWKSTSLLVLFLAAYYVFDLAAARKNRER